LANPAIFFVDIGVYAAGSESDRTPDRALRLAILVTFLFFGRFVLNFFGIRSGLEIREA